MNPPSETKPVHELDQRMATGQAVVPVPGAAPPASAPAGGPLDRWFEDQTTWLCSWDITTPEGKIQALKATEGLADSLSPWIGKTIVVKDLLLHTREVEDDGELKLALRAVLVTVNGDLIGTWSGGALRCLKQMSHPQMFGRPPWNPPLRLEVIQQELKEGHRTYKLFPVFDASPSNKKKEK